MIARTEREGPRERAAARIFHAISRRTPPPEDAEDGTFDDALASSAKFFDRFGGALDVTGRSVLDVGCGTGSTCIEAALRGAGRVVGLDIQERRIETGRAELRARFPELEDRVELRVTDGTLREAGTGLFDVVLSKDSFEHYADPDAAVAAMCARLAPGGVLAVGFGPLWKGPTGGHIRYMTPLPWAHLLFPERVVMAERRRFRPNEAAERYEDVLGGLNRMTLARFRRIMDAPEHGLECVELATNVSGNPVVKAMSLLAKAPPLREYLTANVYGLWRAAPERPAASSR